MSDHLLVYVRRVLLILWVYYPHALEYQVDDTVKDEITGLGLMSLERLLSCYVRDFVVGRNRGSNVNYIVCCGFIVRGAHCAINPPC